MSSILLDLRTLSFTLMLVTALLSFVMIFIWRTQKTYRGFEIWAIGNFLGAIGFFLIGMRGALPDFLTIIAGNAFAFGSLALAFEASRRFLGLKNCKLFTLGLVFLQALVCAYFTYITENVVVRIIVVSLASAIIGGRIAFEFARNIPEDTRRTYQFTSAVYAAFAVFMLARAVLTYFISDIRDFYARDWIQSVVFIILIFFVIVWTFIFVILNNERLQQELKETKSEFERLATTDFLTGINNNRRFFEIGKMEIGRAKRFHHPMTLIMFDIDFFKKINDTYGHAAGDKVLIAVVDICKFNLREMDALGRLGGEEFGVILPHTDIDVGKMVAGRLRRAFEETEIAISYDSIRVTASFGVTAMRDDDTELKPLLNRADVALYEAKQKGRNLVIADSPVNPAVIQTFSDNNSSQTA